MPISSCDKDKMDLAQELDKRYQNAVALLKAGNYEAALQNYLFVFDNSRPFPGWGGVRLSYVPSYILKISEHYPEARQALIERRDEREQLLLNGETDFSVSLEWVALNRSLKENTRCLAFIEKLEKQGKLNDRMRELVIDQNFEHLMAEKNYAKLKPFLNHFGNRFLMHIFNYENETLLPKRASRADDARDLSEYLIGHLKASGSKLYELALGIKAAKKADYVAKKLLHITSDVETFRLLLQAANNAGNKTKARELMRQAKISLTKEDYKRLCA